MKFDEYPEVPGLVCFDKETHVYENMPINPKAVCLSVVTDLAPPPDIPFREMTMVSKIGRRAYLYADEHAGAVLRYYIETYPLAHFVAHFLAFDLLASVFLDDPVSPAAWAQVIDEGRAHCTMEREALYVHAMGWDEKGEVDPRTGQKFGRSLAYLGKVWFGVDLSSEKTDSRGWRMNYSILDDIPLHDWPEDAVDYACLDSVWAGRFFDAQCCAPRPATGTLILEDGISMATEKDQVGAAIALNTLNANVPMANPAWVERFRSYHQSRADKAAALCHAAGLLRWNKSRYKDPDGTKRGGFSAVTKNIQAGVTEGWGAATPLTETGRISTAKGVLMDKRSPLALQVWGSASFNRKMLDTYLPTLKRCQTERVRSRYTTIVSSNRTSCGKPLNWQNQPAFGGARESYEPDEGNCFVSTDYSHIEINTQAQYLVTKYGRSKTADALNAGRDPYLWFATKLWGDDIDELHATYEAGDKDAARKRELCKAPMLGLGGGLGCKIFIELYGLKTVLAMAEEYDKVYIDDGEGPAYLDEQATAKKAFWRIKNIWLQSDPGLKLSKDEVSAKTDDNATYTWVCPQSGFIRGKLGYKNGLNTTFQTPAAAGLKRALWAVWKACYAEDTILSRYGVRMWAAIHDEILTEGPTEYVHIWGPEVERIMIEAMKTILPDVPPKAESVAMLRWWKKAKKATDDQGRLIPWVPDGDLSLEEENDPLDELIAEWEAIHGPVPEFTPPT